MNRLTKNYNNKNMDDNESVGQRVKNKNSIQGKQKDVDESNSKLDEKTAATRKKFCPSQKC